MSIKPHGDFRVLELDPRVQADSQTAGGLLEIYPTRKPASDPTDRQTQRLIEQSGALDFWDDRREDVYTAEDGDPV